MYVITIAQDADEAVVLAALMRVGHPWRPAYDIPRLVFLDGGTTDVIERIDGVRSCQAVEDTPPRQSAGRTGGSRPQWIDRDG